MILDQMHGHMDEPMMGGGSNIWFYGIIALIFIYIIIAFILIYWLARDTSKDIKLTPNKKTSVHPAINQREKVSKPRFCPNCGEKIDDRTLKHCPTCRSKI